MKSKRVYKSLIISLLFSLLSTVALQADETSSAVVQNQILDRDIALFDRALVLSSQQQWVQAENIYRDLIKRHQHWPEVKNNLAVVLLKTSRLDEARKALDSAVVSSSSYQIAHNNRAKLYNYLATQTYNRALGSEQQLDMPELQLIQKIDQAINVAEKKPDVADIKEIVAETVVISQQDVTEHINQQLKDWSHAWSEGDFEQYIRHYSTQFMPSDNTKTFSEWKSKRQARLKYAKGVDVSFDQLRVFLEASGEYALVEFLQYYQSASYSDKVLKQMYMQKQKNDWLILSERIIKTY